MAQYNKIMLRQFNNNTISAQEKRAYNQWAHDRNLEELREMYSRLEMGDRSAKRWGVQENFVPQADGWIPRSSEVMLRSGRVRGEGEELTRERYLKKRLDRSVPRTLIEMLAYSWDEPLVFCIC